MNPDTSHPVTIRLVFGFVIWCLSPGFRMGTPDFKGLEFVLMTSDDKDIVHAYHYPSMEVRPGNPDHIYVVWNDGRWDSESAAFAP